MGPYLRVGHFFSPKDWEGNVFILQKWIGEIILIKVFKGTLLELYDR